MQAEIIPLTADLAVYLIELMLAKGMLLVSCPTRCR